MILRLINIFQLIAYQGWITLTTSTPRINDPNWRGNRRHHRWQTSFQTSPKSQARCPSRSFTTPSTTSSQAPSLDDAWQAFRRSPKSSESIFSVIKTEPRFTLPSKT